MSRILFVSNLPNSDLFFIEQYMCFLVLVVFQILVNFWTTAVEVTSNEPSLVSAGPMPGYSWGLVPDSCCYMKTYFLVSPLYLCDVMIILQVSPKNQTKLTLSSRSWDPKQFPFLVFHPAGYLVHRTTSYGCQVLHVPVAVCSGDFICALCTAASPTGRWKGLLVTIWKTFSTRFCF